MFFIIAIVLSNGANQFFIAVIATLITIIILYFRKVYNDRKNKDNISDSSTNIIQIEILGQKQNSDALVKRLKKNLGRKIISLRNVNLLGDETEFNNKMFVKVRSTGKLLNAKINLKSQIQAQVNLEVSEDGISPGQACVFYKKDKLGYKVLGGGWIKI